MSALPTQPPGQPRSKAASTAQLSVLTPTKNDDKPPPQYEALDSTRVKASRSVAEASLTNATSLLTTFALVQRILAPSKVEYPDEITTSTIEEILPPLTSSNEVDLELYAILAVVVKDFVNTWYTKITPDQTFVDEIIRIFAHCTRALEQRLRRTDVTALLLDELALLLLDHIQAYGIARSAVLGSPQDVSLRHVYHSLLPHPALIPVPDGDAAAVTYQDTESEKAYRQLLVQGTLAILLPFEDLQNDPLRILVGDIVADMIIGQALAGKLCQGWFLHDAINKVTSIVGDRVQSKTSGTELRNDAKSRLEEFGLLSSNVNSQHGHSSVSDQSKVVSWFWRIMQHLFLAFLFLRRIFADLNVLYRNPMRYHRAVPPSSPTGRYMQSYRPTPAPASPSPQPVITFGIFSVISTLLKLDDRMPWLTSMLAFGQHALLHGPPRMGGLNSLFDRFMYHVVESHVLSASLIPMVLRSLRAAVFPNNAMGPPAPPFPSSTEQREIKRRAASSLFSRMPRSCIHGLYRSGSDEDVIDQIERDILEPFDDLYLNKHLMYAVLELVLVKLVPELSERPISELLAEHGVVFQGAKDKVS